MLAKNLNVSWYLAVRYHFQDYLEGEGHHFMMMLTLQQVTTIDKEMLPPCQLGFKGATLAPSMTGPNNALTNWGHQGECSLGFFPPCAADARTP